MTEVTIEDELRVEAPAPEVWEAITDPAAHARWHPFVTDIAGEHRLGQVRTCSVIVGKKRGETMERCVEEHDKSSIVWVVEEDSSGFSRMASNWHAGFALAHRDGATVVTARSTFVPNNVLVRAMVPLIRRKFHRAQRAILAGLKVSLEARAGRVDLGSPRS